MNDVIELQKDLSQLSGIIYRKIDDGKTKEKMKEILIRLQVRLQKIK